MSRTCQCKNRNPSDHTTIFFCFNVLHIILGPFLFNMIHNDWFIIIPTSLHFRRENPLIWNWLCVLKPKKGPSVKNQNSYNNSWEERKKPRVTVTPKQHHWADNSWLADSENWSLQEVPHSKLLDNIGQLQLKEKYPTHIIRHIWANMDKWNLEKTETPIQWPYLKNKYHEKLKTKHPSYIKMLIPSKTSKIAHSHLSVVLQVRDPN